MATLEHEHAIRQAHAVTHIAGLDEAGRGALAGPVVAAAVILPLDNASVLDSLHEVNDSKQLSAATRERLFEQVMAHALATGVGAQSATVVDNEGIIQATKLAMRAALSELTVAPEFLLIDGRIRLTAVALPQQSLIRGDSKSLSIAAASILAKVTRDRLMIALDGDHPGYGFAQHKGYGTAFHRHAIEQLGPTAVHRHTFAPIRKPLL